MRFFLEEAANVGDIVELSSADSRHLRVVLRKKPGAAITVVSANRVFAAELADVGDVVTAKLLREVEAYGESELGVILLQGLAKGERMEIVLQKAVELGASRIVPVACERSVVRLDAGRAANKQQRWQKIADSAAKQCGRIRLAEVAAVQDMRTAIAGLPEGCRIIMPWEEADGESIGMPLSAALAEERPQSVAIIIGPEGGLTAEEANLAKDAGARLVTLGKRILRTETAAIAALAVVMYAWGDLNGE